MPELFMSELVAGYHRVRNTLIFIGIIVGIATLVLFLK
jgi:hypothetical protein